MGGHPRFQDYLEWARIDQGCAYKSGYAKIDSKVETFVTIENPANGKHAIEFIPFDEYLTPSMVSALDRRLGLDSPFPKMVSYD
jgi:hypothetical protein